MKKYIILSNNNFFKKKIKKKNYFFFFKKSELKLSKLDKIKPDLIFVPHWNYKIDNKIISKYKTIIFHSTPLPYGRGGSPIQNMITRNHKKTTVCAIEAKDILDSGKIFIKRQMKLNGSANEIYQRMYLVILSMIKDLVKKLPKPKSQKGKIVIFKRRFPSQSVIKEKKYSLNKLYDHIRMLDYDREGFPKAYLNFKNLKIIFSNPKIQKNKIINCNATIKLTN